MSCSDSFDPFQVFEVEHKPCMILYVRVIQGRNITKGWVRDLIDTPDPYILLRMKTAPDGTRTTTPIYNEKNPKWNDTFRFLLDSSKRNILEISLMEANYYTIDQTLGTLYFNVNELTMNETKRKTFIFNEVSEIDMELKIEIDSNPTLRYSLCLCDEEKQFLRERKMKVMEAMKKLLGDKGPTDLSHVPTIGILGSGGGFRAMTGLAGVFKALVDSEILNTVTYAAGLSGSSWYLSTLYSHPDWPKKSPGDLLDELKHSIDSSLLWLLKPQSVYRYLDNILHKRNQGQPVSFTDFFGHLVGETLLKNRLHVKLTDQQAKIEKGDVPFPLFTCVHVKKDVSARVFQEWVEFSPYEIGMPKYGTFMKSGLFGSKFFLGQLSKQFEEPPLHFLQGIWGSAFCILFKRLLKEKAIGVETIHDDIVREEMHTELDHGHHHHESSDSSASDEDTDEENETRPSKRRKLSHYKRDKEHNGNSHESTSSGDHPRLKSSTQENLASSLVLATASIASPFSVSSNKRIFNGNDKLKCNRKFKMTRQISRQKTKERGFWTSFLEGMFESTNFPLLSTRAGRAGIVHNPLRGLSLQRSYPISPFTPAPSQNPPFLLRSPDEFDGIFEMYPTHIKKLYMVDAGLTFNSPFPLLLRPQRRVDLFLSFDFSARPTDDTQPFKELLLAEKWARVNNVPFPPIDVSTYKNEDMKEVYVFRHPTDQHCPIVMHFVLANINFRLYKKPGVPRETKEELEFADFSLFDDPNSPYSTFNFKYSHEAFDRLSQLTEFNTLQSVPLIKDVIAECIEKKRKLPPKVPINSNKVKLLRIKTLQHRNQLKDYLKRLESICSQKSDTEQQKSVSSYGDVTDTRENDAEDEDDDLYQTCSSEYFDDEVFEAQTQIL